MHRYAGILRYTTDNSGRRGQSANVVLAVSFSPGRFTVTIEDPNARSVLRLTNRRFNYQARDSTQDLLARVKWRNGSFGRSTGPAYLGCHRIPGVPRELRVTVICRWAPAFAVVEFRLGGNFYLFSRRPPRGENSRGRLSFPMFTDSGEDEEDGDSREQREPPSGSHEPPADDPPCRRSADFGITITIWGDVIEWKRT